MPFDVRDCAAAAPENRTADHHGRRLVALWLFAVAGMVLVMIILGGMTRLTGSGLSIMEWAPFAGTLPPTSNAQWQRLYHLYQQIPQYALVNPDIGLDGFKRIFWLEWVHRLWGRLVGLAFLLPLIWLWATNRIERWLRMRLASLFALGGLQGAAGWFMVVSGFEPAATAVSPYRLVVHLALAMLLYAALLWTGLTVLHPTPPRPPAGRLLHGLSWVCCGSVALTILAGGLVAGTHAGLDYNTFPLMGGRVVPAGYARLEPFARNLTENIAAVQFHHRLLALLTALTAAAVLLIGLALRPPRAVPIALLAFAGAALLQYVLGVATLLLIVPVPLALIHQATAVLLLTAAIGLLHSTRRTEAGYHE
jgi:cytochrome c oxidase assembly protein subunit 15